MALVPRATSELVTAAWISSIPGFTAGTGEQLPDETTWYETGFVTVAVAGGSPDVDMRIGKPVMQIDCWAAAPGSNKPPWQLANNIAEQIRAAAYDRLHFGRPLTLAVNDVPYPLARAMTVYVLTEPHRVYGDSADLAGYSFDAQVQWISLT